jgi:predicted ABC-type ATPase
MIEKTPRLLVLAGPNGAGKSTIAARVLRGPLAVSEFVNADTIARGLSEFHPERVALAAGKIMLRRLQELARERVSFAFETTLASRSFAPWIERIVRAGYEIHVVFLWLASADEAVARVAERVRLGGHDVPEPTIRRRYAAGLRNFFCLYQPLASRWKILNNSGKSPPRVVVAGRGRDIEMVEQRNIWRRIQKEIGREVQTE